MRILVFGAGVLGGNLANALYSQGKDVTILARGSWYEQINKKGLSIHNYFGRRTNAKIPVINKLKDDDRYNVIFVVVRYNQIDSVLPVLKVNVSKTIVFVGNNLRTREITSALNGKNILFAFASSAGHREDDHIRSVTLNRITVGNIKGKPVGERFIRKVFSGTRYKVSYERNMEDWLLCHAAAVIPIAFACYHTDGDIKRLKRDRKYIGRLMDATIAAYSVLEDNGHEILPDSDKGFRDPGFKKKYMPFYRFIFATKIGKLCTADHAMNAVDEMSALNEDFKRYMMQFGDVPREWIDLEKDTKGYLKSEDEKKEKSEEYAMELTFGDVQETALIPLAIKASETARPNARITDMKAKEIIDALGVDVSKYDPFLSHEGVVARTLMYRETLKKIISRYPDALCINLGCGFDDKFSQVDNGKITWFDVDLPDQIEKRRRVYSDRDRCTMLNGSALESEWTKQLPKNDMNIIVMEGVLEYFNKEQVKTCLNMLCDSFGHGYLLAELHSPFLEKHGSHHDAVKHTNATFGWGTKSGREYLDLEPRMSLVSETSYNEEMKKYSIRGKLFAIIGRNINNRLAVFKW